jgi:hypothetical protein
MKPLLAEATAALQEGPSELKDAVRKHKPRMFAVVKSGAERAAQEYLKKASLPVNAGRIDDDRLESSLELWVTQVLMAAASEV